MAISYRDSGVDVTAGYKAVKLMKKHVKSTFDSNVLGDLGSFAGLYSLAGFNYKEPVLVSGTDGVGTKLKYAFITGRHDTVGIDCVAMCANDIVCQGARPLFFLDYIALPKLVPELAERIVAGISEGCRQAGCALIGGETAEMPGFYSPGEYDMAGFCVGIAEKSKLITGKSVEAGDVLIGVASSGLHSNGFSLVRRLFGEDKAVLEAVDEELGAPLADVLLTPTRIYVKSVLSLIEKIDVKGIAHITGGGFIENIPRIFPSGIGCRIDLSSYQLSDIFRLLAKRSGLSNQELYNTFNMGVGLVIAVSARDADAAIKTLKENGETAFVLGHTMSGEGVEL